MNLATLHDIADRLERLAPSHRDPHRYFEEKSEMVAELRRLAAGHQILAGKAANDNCDKSATSKSRRARRA
ncbi:hypothetical protein ACC684_10975 [Rhizobium ruizarguesonis]|uniref:hypothetical protein n=1 Tax=Rhizobium ruizarguesonis TaxID=2081791 RepID=UPI0010300801|nr:hypothetical protein [Rhizobium ruizarguesonis]TBB03432.1 hypothetical protein ELH52_18410 [Rhizobium ruizarguesonis]